MLVGVPMNMGLGSFSFSSSLPAGGLRAQGSQARRQQTAKRKGRGGVETSIRCYDTAGRAAAPEPRGLSCGRSCDRPQEGPPPMPTTTRYPPRVHPTTAAAAAAFTIVPRHVLGGQKFVAPSDKVNVAIIGAGGQGRTNARALFQEEDCQVIALADPAEEWDLSRGTTAASRAGGPVKAEVEKHYAEKTPNHTVRGLRRLPGHAREGEGDRRRPDRHARSPARVRLDPRDEGGQARVLREAAHAQHPRGTARGARRRRRPASRRRWATSAARARAIARPSSGSRTARSAPCARCTPGAARRAPPRTSGRARGRRPSPPGSTGISGSARAPTGPTAES